MSVSNKLQTLFWALETAAFLEWRDATPERREEITRELGQLEGKLILEEIEKESHAIHQTQS